MASKRHARANNPLVEGCDPGQPSSHILYLDANNLYGWTIYPPAAFVGWMTASSWQKLSQSNQLTAPRATYLRWTWSTQRTYTTRTIHIRCHRSAWWFRRSGCRSISTTSSELGWRQQRLRSWSQISLTRTTMCFTIGSAAIHVSGHASD